MKRFFSGSTFATLLMSLPFVSIATYQYVGREWFIWLTPIILLPMLFSKVYQNRRLMLLTLYFGVAFLALTLAIVNGFDSLRIAVIAGFSTAVLLRSDLIKSWSIYVGICGLAFAIYSITDGLSRFVTKAISFTEDSSINLIGVTSMFLLVLCLSINQKREQLIGLLIVGFLTFWGAFFIDSRQLLLIPIFSISAILLLFLSKKTLVSLFVLFVSVLLPISYYFEVALTEKISNLGLDSERWDLYNCYFSKLDTWALFFGSHSSPSGSCGVGLLGGNYLHSSYLEFLASFGLIGLLLIMIFCVGIIRSMLQSQWNKFLILIYCAVYGVFENIGFWMFFYGCLCAFNYCEPRITTRSYLRAPV